ncbi:MAG: molybdopterin molybdotransferase MoeA [Pseudomonadota bacterium]
MDQSKFKLKFIGFEEAFRLAMDNVPTLPKEWVDTGKALNRVLAGSVKAAVDSPSVDSSIKDGYAVISSDLAEASALQPVELGLVGSIGAGTRSKKAIAPGTAMRILSGAMIPEGVDAVLANEFAEEKSGVVRAFADAHSGRNILRRGTDISLGETLANPGSELAPGLIGLLVAGGVSKVSVFSRPRISLLATGDEVLLPGKPIKKGELYASNVALQDAWLRSKGIECSIEICGDSFEKLATVIESKISRFDVLITSGGAWTGDRDLTVKVLNNLGWNPIFHKVRMGPGKGVGMGLLNSKPVFCLPGGPPSNEMAFLMIVLPAVLRMAGHTKTLFPELFGRLTSELLGQLNWTQFVHCDVTRQGSEFFLTPLNMRRVSGMRKTTAILKIPEGVDRINSGAVVPFAAIDLDLS